MHGETIKTTGECFEKIVGFHKKLIPYTSIALNVGIRYFV